MKLYAPDYYKSFTCIADKCSHSCCIGWEIDVDGETAEKYASLKGGYGDTVRTCLDTSDVPHFPLLPDGRCPHLDEKGLCRIILNLGEEYLCEICREHPRFYNDTPYGKEVGLGMVCEEACRIILSTDSYSEITPIGELPGAPLTSEDFDAVAQRSKIYSILSDKFLSYPEKLKRICCLYQVFPENTPDAEWRELLDSLEYLDESHRYTFSKYTSLPRRQAEAEPLLERALAYFIYRHCSAAADKSEFCAALGFALFCENLIASVSHSVDEIYSVAQAVSEELEYSEDNTEEIKSLFLF